VFRLFRIPKNFEEIFIKLKSTLERYDIFAEFSPIIFSLRIFFSGQYFDEKFLRTIFADKFFCGQIFLRTNFLVIILRTNFSADKKVSAKSTPSIYLKFLI